MNGERLPLKQLPSMYFLFLQITVAAAAAGCLQYKFIKEHGVSLENHVMKSIPNILPYTCRSLCVHTPFCFSVNMKTKQGPKVTCELNNSSRVADPQDFKSEAGSEYHQMAVRALFFVFFFSLICLYSHAHFFLFCNWGDIWKHDLFNTGAKRNGCSTTWLREMKRSCKTNKFDHFETRH